MESKLKLVLSLLEEGIINSDEAMLLLKTEEKITKYQYTYHFNSTSDTVNNGAISDNKR